MEETSSPKISVNEVFEELLEREDEVTLKTILIDLHPADIAEAFVRIDNENRLRVLALLETETAAEVLVELDTSVRQDLLRVLREIDEARMVEIIGAMDSDDATDVIGEFEDEIAQRILKAMPWKEFREVKTLLRHDEETAGGIMALEIVAVNQNKTSRQAMDVLRRKADEVEDVYNIYVVDDVGVLQGVVSLKELVLADPRTKLATMMHEETISIRPEMDQEEVANIFHKYDLVSAPVVDEQGRLVGRITVDDVLDVVEEEASEDITKMAGIITHEEIAERSILKTSGVRIPWLLVAFVGQMVSAKILEYFIPDSHQNIALATCYIPLIMAMAGNIGIQSSTVIIRGLALGDIRLRDTGRRLFQELSVAILNGLVIGLLLFNAVSILHHKPQFGLVLGISLVLVLFVAGLIGTLVPLILKRLKIDPAIATGPFITTSNDVLGLVIYFSIVRAFAPV